VITFDTGALIALDHRKQRMLRMVGAATAAGERITIPTVVLTEWWRGPPSRRMRELLAGVVIEPLEPRLARIAGEAIAAIRGATVVDAIVMGSAAQRGDTVFSGDIEDMQRLQRYFPAVRVLHA
jgi:predicted nucleic acid-binding protein